MGTLAADGHLPVFGWLMLMLVRYRTMLYELDRSCFRACDTPPNTPKLFCFLLKQHGKTTCLMGRMVCYPTPDVMFMGSIIRCLPPARRPAGNGKEDGEIG